MAPKDATPTGSESSSDPFDVDAAQDLPDDTVVATEHTEIADDLDDDIWVEEPSGPSILTRMFAEAAGTFIVMFMGLGAALVMMLSGQTSLTTILGFAIGLVVAIVVFSGVSGSHVNPAVSIAMWMSGRFPGRDVVPYVISQIIGGLLAGLVLFVLLSSHEQIPDASSILVSASNGYGEHSPMGFAILAALVIEFVIATLFVSVVLAATSTRAKASAASAPLVIGLAFGFLMLIAIPFTNGALNPVRATAAAVFSEPWALQQLWVFWVAPLIGAAVAGLLFRAFGPEEDLIIIEQVEVVETLVDLED